MEHQVKVGEVNRNMLQKTIHSIKYARIRVFIDPYSRIFHAVILLPQKNPLLLILTKTRCFIVDETIFNFPIMLPKHSHGLKFSRNIGVKYLFYFKTYFHVLDKFHAGCLTVFDSFNFQQES